MGYIVLHVLHLTSYMSYKIKSVVLFLKFLSNLLLLRNIGNYLLYVGILK